MGKTLTLIRRLHQPIFDIKSQNRLPVSTRDDTDDIDYNPEISSAAKLLETCKKGLKYLGSFWKICKEYLLILRERQQTKLKGSRVQSPYTANVRDVVLIKDDLPRGSCRLGRIQELIKSRDRQCRSVRVLLASNKVIGRPLNLLYPVECQAAEMNRDSQNQTKQQTADKQNAAEIQIDRVDSGDRDSGRPKRLAASTARDRIIEQLSNEQNH